MCDHIETERYAIQSVDVINKIIINNKIYIPLSRRNDKDQEHISYTNQEH